MIENYQQAMNALSLCNQTHLLHFWEELNPKEKENLLNQINMLNFKKISGWVTNYIKNESPVEVPRIFEPAAAYPANPQNAAQQEKYKEAVRVGRALIKQGKVAAFVVAGGQGTRLGFEGPKGSYPISPVKQKTLYQIFAENIRATRAKYSIVFPFYIMTNLQNDAATRKEFIDNNYYGLGAENVIIFQQGALPLFDFDGRIFLADKDTIAVGPDGHGGSLKALHASGALADMNKRGIEHISYWQVDNPLVRLFDPLFIGLHVLDGAGMSSKALIKTHPTEKVGNFCLVNGRVTVIEYSDLDEEHAYRKNPDGSLVFELGSIAIHILSVSFVEKLNAKGDFALPLHRAVKKIPHIDRDGNKVEPDKPCGVKLETFVFDALPLSEKSVILQTIRSEEFAPVKNASGPDSAEVTRQMMSERAAAWLESAGVKVPRTPDGRPDCTLEIAPSFALSAEDIKPKAKSIPPIRRGQSVFLE